MTICVVYNREEGGTGGSEQGNAMINSISKRFSDNHVTIHSFIAKILIFLYMPDPKEE